MLNPEIRDDSVSKLPESTPVSAAKEKEEEESSQVDSGVSSIEKSKNIKPELVPPMDSPILTTPSKEECLVFAIALVDATGMPVTETVKSFILKGEEIKNSVLEAWADNLREIAEYVRQLLSSPMYQQLQEIRQKGDPRQVNVSGVQGPASANAAAAASQKTESVDFLSTVTEHLKTIERVPPAIEVVDSSAPQDASRVLVIPLTAALLIGGGLAIGSAHGAVDATNPLKGVFELVERVQPIFPQVSIQDLIPVINLMIAVPIYYNSWNEAISNFKNRERHNYVQTAQNFAKDVIKIVTDPQFVQGMLIQRMKGTDQLSPQDQERLSRILKVVLISVALSLLYSVEVGKVGNGKFGGIEPEELRELLMGKFSPSDPNKKPNLQEQLTASLINRAWEQLASLSLEDRTMAVNILIDYVTKNRDLDPMLDPAKIFDEALASTHFNPRAKLDMFKA